MKIYEKLFISKFIDRTEWYLNLKKRGKVKMMIMRKLVTETGSNDEEMVRLINVNGHSNKE